MSSKFDARGLKCPLGFVKAKQHLKAGKTDQYLFDDKMTLTNFTNYLTKMQIPFLLCSEDEVVSVTLNLGNNN